MEMEVEVEVKVEMQMDMKMEVEEEVVVDVLVVGTVRELTISSRIEEKRCASKCVNGRRGTCHFLTGLTLGK